MQMINDRHAQEIAALTNKYNARFSSLRIIELDRYSRLKITEERFHREFSSRARLESDFRVRIFLH